MPRSSRPATKSRVGQLSPSLEGSFADGELEEKEFLENEGFPCPQGLGHCPGPVHEKEYLLLRRESPLGANGFRQFRVDASGVGVQGRPYYLSDLLLSESFRKGIDGQDPGRGFVRRFDVKGR